MIRRYSRSGSDMGTYVSHLGYAYSYGDGGEVSCEDLREAVSNLLGGIPVNEYAVTNRSCHDLHQRPGRRHHSDRSE